MITPRNVLSVAILYSVLCRCINWSDFYYHNILKNNSMFQIAFFSVQLMFSFENNRTKVKKGTSEQIM